MRRTVTVLVGVLAGFVLVASGCGGPQPAPDTAPRGCDTLVLDTDAGVLNGLAPEAPQATIRAQLPCATGATEEGSSFNRGGGVFFLDHDVFFYTHADFIEVRDRFPGEVRPPLLGRDRADVGQLLGRAVDDYEAESASVARWDRPYGCLVLLFEGEAVATIRVHASGCAATPTSF